MKSSGGRRVLYRSLFQSSTEESIRSVEGKLTWKHIFSLLLELVIFYNIDGVICIADDKKLYLHFSLANQSLLFTLTFSVLHEPPTFLTYRTQNILHIFYLDRSRFTSLSMVKTSRFHFLRINNKIVV